MNIYQEYIRLRKLFARFLNKIILIIQCHLYPVKKIKTNKSSLEKTLLLVEIVGIGDYILFRNFLSTIKNSKKFAEYKIIIALSSLCAEIAKKYDSLYFDEIIEIEPKECRQKIYEKLAKTSPNVIFNPHISRFINIDNIIHAIDCCQKTAVFYSYNNNFKLYAKYTNRYFSTILYPKVRDIFEFDLNKNIIEQFINESVSIEKTHIKADMSLPILKTLPEKYVAVYIDASWYLRKWSADNHIKTIKYINQYHELPVVLLGQDSVLGRTIADNIETNNINLCCSVSLIELVSILAKAQLVLSGDTGAMHIATAANVNTICISNGNNFGRFVPYPKEYSNNKTIFVEYIYKHIGNYRYLHNKFKRASFYDINEIKIEKVHAQIDYFLNL